MQWGKVGTLLLTIATTLGQQGFGQLGFVQQGQLGFGPPGFGQQGFGQTEFGRQGHAQPGFLQSQFGQHILKQSGISRPGFSQAGYNQGFHHQNHQETLKNTQFGQQRFDQTSMQVLAGVQRPTQQVIPPRFVEQGFAHRGVGQAFGDPLGVSTFEQPGVGMDALGNPTRSGVRVAGPNNQPLESSSSDTCRQWCKGAVRGQFYCCEENTEPLTVPIVKSGGCPPLRSTCPENPPTPITCGDDSKCPGRHKCCFDGCINVHVCARPIL
ncbi:uncharacterized protein LOC135218306 [Macrobrachium nipponense]|uniref:uncharacterized protein LOC135218306 n=1 Tax=Macrobrachium nipponense TaxID=159736 RepID=UPI0030C7D0B5